MADDYYTGGLTGNIKDIFGKDFKSGWLSNPMQMMKHASQEWNIPEHKLKPGMFPSITREMLSKINPGRYMPFLEEETNPLQSQIASQSYFGKGRGEGLQTGKSTFLTNLLKSKLPGARDTAMDKVGNIVGREESMLRALLSQMFSNLTSLK